jgi:hypothetical protein
VTASNSIDTGDDGSSSESADETDPLQCVGKSQHAKAAISQTFFVK